MLRLLSISFASLALLTGCGGGSDPEAVLETVRLTEQAQLEALASKDLDGIVRNYEADAVLLVPGRRPAEGVGAIRQAYEELLDDPNAKLEVRPTTAWAAASGDLAVTTATGKMTMTNPGTGQTDTVPVTNQTVWRKSAGDPWKIVSEYNVTPAGQTDADSIDENP